ncbi:MAG: DUF6383 domain-containing protein [Dysgonomonas sp.]
MKKIYSILTLCLLLFGISTAINAQATLPVNATFSGVTTSGPGTMPTGFTQNGLGGYNGALKFDTEGDWLQLNFNGAPDQLQFDLGVNNSFPGSILSTMTFTVEESTNGTTWTSVASYTNVAGGTKKITLLNSSRFVRWTYTTKPSGSNIALKNISVTASTASATPTITTNSESLSFSGQVGSSIAAQTINVTAANLTANITASISGTNASLFSVTPASLTTTGGSLSVTYTPTAAGSHTATLTLKSTGATDKTIVLTGTATAAPVSTPTATQPTVEKIDMDKFIATWNAISGADSYILNVYTKSTTSDPVEETETEGFDGIVANGNLIGSATYLNGWEVSVTGTRQIYTTTGNFGASSPSIAFSETGAYLKTRVYTGNIKSFSFWAKQQSGATSSTLIEGFNGTDWVSIANASNAEFATAGVVTYDLVTLGYSNISQIRMTYTKVAGNLAIDDVTVVYINSSPSRSVAAEVKVPVSGYQDLNVGNVLSQQVTGLSEATHYFYTVKAVQNGVESAESNEIEVTTISTPLSIIDSKTIDNNGIKVYKQGQNIIVESDRNALVSVYSIAGKLIGSKSLVDGKTTITVPNGVYIVRVGNKATKIVL